MSLTVFATNNHYLKSFLATLRISNRMIVVSMLYLRRLERQLQIIEKSIKNRKILLLYICDRTIVMY
jgi:hypothetical protein